MTLRRIGLGVGALVLTFIVASALTAVVRWWIDVLILYGLVAAGLVVYGRRVGQPFNRPVFILMSVPTVAALAALVLPTPWDSVGWGIAAVWFVAWRRHYSNAAKRANAASG